MVQNQIIRGRRHNKERQEGLMMSSIKPKTHEVLELQLLGCHDGGELQLIKENLLQVEGVDGVEVNLALRSITIEYDVKIIVVEVLIERIEDMGFGALTIPKKNKENDEKKNRTCNNCIITLLDSLKDIEPICELNIDLGTKEIVIRIKSREGALMGRRTFKKG
ncbi:MAG: heavy-metal-associated domain-containing protein [Candidatus Hodarchaeales archaeon]